MEEIEVLDTNLLIEGKSGLTTVFNLLEYPPAIYHGDFLWPERIDYERALLLASKLRLQGTPVGCTDMLIASMCLVRNFTLITRDHDFQHIKKIETEFKLKIV